MKKTLYTLVMLLLATLCLPSCSEDVEEPVVVPEEEEDTGTPSLPLLVEGRTWVVCFDPGEPTAPPVEEKSYSFLTIGGDSLWEGKVYKPVISERFSVKNGIWKSLEPHVYRLMREQNGRIYIVEHDPKTGIWQECIDFDCNTAHGTTWQVNGAGYSHTYAWNVGDTITADGIKRRTYDCLRDAEDVLDNGHVYTSKDTLDSYIEGIGYIGSSFYHSYKTVGSIERLVCCHDADGTCLYSRDPDHNCPLKASQE